MNWVDYAILAVIAVSALISLLRGFIREALDLAGWVLAFWLALRFTDTVASAWLSGVSVPSLRLALAFFIIFVGVLLAASLVNYGLGQLVEKTGLSGMDRLVGVVFGLARGAVLVAVLVLLAGLTALPRDPWWRESLMLEHFQRLAVELRGLLPADIASHFRY